MARSSHRELMRILVDMNLTPRWGSYLIAAGHTVVHWSEIGSVCATDAEICDYARDHKYVLLTNDLDFPRVIFMRGEPLIPENRGIALLSAIEICQSEINQGAIVTLDSEDRSRARVLPLG